MPYFIKVKGSAGVQGFMQTGTFIDYTVRNWHKKEKQEKIKLKFRTDEMMIERIIKYIPDIGDLISEIHYGLMSEIAFAGNTIYIRPTLKEVLDIYNGIMNEGKNYDPLAVESKFSNIQEMEKAYDSILNDNKQLRNDYKWEREEIYKKLNDENRRSDKPKTASEIIDEINRVCKEKYHPLFLAQYYKMREYSEEARKFFFRDENLKNPPGFDFFKWSELKRNWVNWDYSFNFSNFSPFAEKIKSPPLFDLSSDEEDDIMRALGDGEGDPYGY